MRVLVGDTAPKDIYAAVPYEGRWYWIANTDIEFKTTFGIVMLLFSISRRYQGRCAGGDNPSPMSNDIRQEAA